MKYLLIVLLASVFIACGHMKNPKVVTKTPSQSRVLADFVHMPQNVEAYTQDINISQLYEVQKNYEQHYFAVWDLQKPSKTLEDAQWPFKSFHPSKSYAENLLLHKKDFFETMRVKSHFQTYATLNTKAITTQHTNMRAFPTDRPLLRNPSLAGEGFPFDYLQNSSIHANTPLFVSHYSADKQWAFVFSSFTFGWVEVDSIALIDDAYAQQWKSAQQVRVTQEGVTVYNEHEKALFATKIGMLFALIGEDANNYIVLTVSSGTRNEAIFHRSLISKELVSKDTLKLNKKNINRILKEVSKSTYGWGGVYGQRDCSSTLMDFFSPFGIWLPRNSSKQGQVGETLNLSKLNDADKVQFIKEEAKAFETLLYRKGHIVLYVGTYKGEIVVFQNVWGVRTKKASKEDRFLVGRPVFSTLRLGNELEDYDASQELLKNIKSMNTLTR